MSKKILNLINNNKWNMALETLDDMFDQLYAGKTLFHYACMRGNRKIIEKYLATKSNKIYMADYDGNSGMHLLAYSEWDDLLLKYVKKYPLFLKLQNLNGDFVYDAVKDRTLVLESIIDIMENNKMTKYLNVIKPKKRTLFLDVIDRAEYDDDYINILNKLHTLVNYKTIPDPPPLIYSMYYNYDKVTRHMLSVLKTDVKIEDSYQVTPLLIAIKNNNEEFAKLILKLNPDVNYSGWQNKNVPLSVCLKHGLINIAEIMVKNTNIDFDNKDAKLNTPIYYLIYLIENTKNKVTKSQLIRLKKLLDIMIEKSNLSNLNIKNETPISLFNNFKLFEYFKDTIFVNNDKTQNNKADGDLSSLVNLTSDENFDNISILSNSSESDEKTIDVVLPKVLETTEFGLFNSNITHAVLYLIVMLNKYDELQMPTQKYLEEKREWNAHNYVNIMTKSTEVVHHVTSYAYDWDVLFTKLAPGAIIWNSKKLYHLTSDTIYLEKCLLNKHKRFIMYKIIITEVGSHSNILIYDKELNKIIRFEPYGDWVFSDTYNLDELIAKMFKNAIKNVFGNKISKSLKYIKPSDYLDKTKFQTSSMGDENTEKFLGDPSGYCLAWSHWFLELKMLNPNADENILVNSALKKIINNGKNKSNPLLSYIRSYAKYLDNEKNKLLEKIGIQKEEIYKLNYERDKEDLISNYLNQLEL